MKKKLGILALCASIMAVSSSLSAGLVSGKVVDAASKAPAKGVFVILHQASDEAAPASRIVVPVGGDGTFKVNVPEGEASFQLFISDKEINGFIYEGFAHISKTEDLGTIEISRGCAVTGRLSDEEGNPVAGAEVKAEIRLKKYTCSHFADASSTKSAPDGSFELKDLAPREYQFSVTSGDLFCEPVKLPLTDDFNYVEFKLKPGCRIQGKVLGSDGKPIPGVAVSVEERKTSTLADGTFALSGIGDGERSLYFSSDSYVLEGSKNIKVKCQPGQAAECIATMVPAGKLIVEVKAQDGLEMPKTISASFRENAIRISSIHSSSTQIKEGKAEFSGLRPGSFKVNIRGDRNLPDTEFNVKIEPGASVNLQVALSKTAGISGRVLDEQGRPVAEARIQVKPAEKTRGEPRFNSGRFERSAQDGSFEYQDLKPGEYVLEAEHEEWLKTKMEIQVEDGGEYTVRLAKGLSIAGSVMESDGTPVEGLTVSLNGVLPGDDYVFKRGKTSSDGSFVVTGLPEGKFGLVLSDDDSREVISTMADIKAGTEGIMITLGRKTKIVCIVSDENGKPIEGASLESRRENEQGRGYWPTRRSDAAEKTGADGKICIQLRAGAKYKIDVWKPPFLPAEKVIDLQDGKEPPAEPVCITLDKGVVLTGRVLDSAGKPVKGLYVTSQPPSRDFFDTFGDQEAEAEEGIKLTGDDGAFRVEGLGPGVTPVFVLSGHKDRSLICSAKFDLKKGQENRLDISVPELASFKGIILDRESKPASEAGLVLSNIDTPQIVLTAQTAADGSFELPRIPAGKYNISWFIRSEKKPYSGIRENVEITPASGAFTLGGPESGASSSAVRISVSKDTRPFGGELVLLPRPPEGTRPDMKEVMAFTSRSKYAERVSEGLFEVGNIAPGRYVFVAETEGGPYPGPVEIPAGAKEIKIDLKSGTCTGKVLGPDGGPAANAMVELLPEKFDFETLMIYANGQTNDKGEFSITGIPPGRYKGIARHKDGIAIIDSLEIKEGSDAKLEVRISKGFTVSGKVLLDDGGLPASAWVIAVGDKDFPLAFARVKPDSGEFKLDTLLPNGRCRIFVTMMDYSTSVSDMQIEGDASLNAVICKAGSIRIKGGAGISPEKFSLKDSSGADVQRISALSAHYNSLSRMGICITDSSGNVSFKGLSPGEYTVVADGREIKCTVKPLEETILTVD